MNRRLNVNWTFVWLTGLTTYVVLSDGINLSRFDTVNQRLIVANERITTAHQRMTAITNALRELSILAPAKEPQPGDVLMEDDKGNYVWVPDPNYEKGGATEAWEFDTTLTVDGKEMTVGDIFQNMVTPKDKGGWR